MSWHRTGSNFLMTNLGHFNKMDLLASHNVLDIPEGYQGITIARNPIDSIASAICNDNNPEVQHDGYNVLHMVKMYYDFHLEVLALKHNTIIDFNDLTRRPKETVEELLKNTNFNLDDYYEDISVDNRYLKYKASSREDNDYYNVVAELRKAELSGCNRAYAEMLRRAMFVPGEVAVSATE